MRAKDETKRTGTWLVAVALTALLVGCGGKMPEDLGAESGQLGACPSSPNCVSSAVNASDEEHSIAALAITGDPEAAWAAAREVVSSTPRTTVERAETDYLHAVYVSSLMRYRDDLELLLDREGMRIEVRSASRVGYGDMGVNRARVEALRAALAERGVVRAAAD